MHAREGGRRRWSAGLVVAVVSTVLVSACSSAVSGHGSTGGSRSPRKADFPSTSAGPATSSDSSASGAPASTASPSAAQPAGRRIVFTGTVTQRRYHAIVWASDTIRDCAAHAYGAQIIAFLQRHRCGPTHRVLATVYLNGMPVDVSSIATSFAGHGVDIYRPTVQFIHLEQAAGTGSINDLLREGASIPGASGRIPPHEAFQVLSQDTGADILDAWYANGPTRNQDPQLLRLEQDVFLSRLATA